MAEMTVDGAGPERAAAGVAATNLDWPRPQEDSPAIGSIVRAVQSRGRRSLLVHHVDDLSG